MRSTNDWTGFSKGSSNKKKIIIVSSTVGTLFLAGLGTGIGLTVKNKIQQRQLAESNQQFQSEVDEFLRKTPAFWEDLGKDASLILPDNIGAEVAPDFLRNDQITISQNMRRKLPEKFFFILEEYQRPVGDDSKVASFKVRFTNKGNSLKSKIYQFDVKFQKTAHEYIQDSFSRDEPFVVPDIQFWQVSKNRMEPVRFKELLKANDKANYFPIVRASVDEMLSLFLMTASDKVYNYVRARKDRLTHEVPMEDFVVEKWNLDSRGVIQALQVRFSVIFRMKNSNLSKKFTFIQKIKENRDREYELVPVPSVPAINPAPPSRASQGNNQQQRPAAQNNNQQSQRPAEQSNTQQPQRPVEQNGNQQQRPAVQSNTQQPQRPVEQNGNQQQRPAEQPNTQQPQRPVEQNGNQQQRPAAQFNTQQPQRPVEQNGNQQQRPAAQSNTQQPQRPVDQNSEQRDASSRGVSTQPIDASLGGGSRQSHEVSSDESTRTLLVRPSTALTGTPRNFKKQVNVLEIPGPATTWTMPNVNSPRMEEKVREDIFSYSPTVYDETKLVEGQDEMIERLLSTSDLTTEKIRNLFRGKMKGIPNEVDSLTFAYGVAYSEKFELFRKLWIGMSRSEFSNIRINIFNGIKFSKDNLNSIGSLRFVIINTATNKKKTIAFPVTLRTPMTVAEINKISRLQKEATQYVGALALSTYTAGRQPAKVSVSNIDPHYKKNELLRAIAVAYPELIAKLNADGYELDIPKTYFENRIPVFKDDDSLYASLLALYRQHEFKFVVKHKGALGYQVNKNPQIALSVMPVIGTVETKEEYETLLSEVNAKVELIKTMVRLTPTLGVTIAPDYANALVDNQDRVRQYLQRIPELSMFVASPFGVKIRFFAHEPSQKVVRVWISITKNGVVSTSEVGLNMKFPFSLADIKRIPVTEAEKRKISEEEQEPRFADVDLETVKEVIANANPRLSLSSESEESKDFALSSNLIYE